jgi:muramoyltetrapeptide carboxypeptidase
MNSPSISPTHYNIYGPVPSAEHKHKQTANIKHWHKLNKGDTACIVAPSYGHSTSENITAALELAINIVKNYDLTPLIYQNSISPENHTLFNDKHLKLANSDEVKISHLMDAFNNPNCDLVWAYRGGYGAIRLLNDLSKEPAPNTIKPFIGFSDITILHNYINNAWGWPSIHFGMPGSLQNVMQREDTKQSLKNIIFGTKNTVVFELKSLNNHPDKINAITAGGNMFVFEKLLGTKFSPILNNRIIVLEDVGEPVRKIDGFLQKLQLMPDFEKISAIIFAHFTPIEDQYIFDRVFQDFAQHTDVSVFQMYPNNTIGHDEINYAFPLGAEAVILANGAEFQLTINSGISSGMHDEF